MVDKSKQLTKSANTLKLDTINLQKKQERSKFRHPTEVCKLTFSKENISMKIHPKECIYRSLFKHGNTCFHEHCCQLNTNSAVEDKDTQLERLTKKFKYS